MAIKGIIRDVTSVTKVMLVREKKNSWKRECLCQKDFFQGHRQSPHSPDSPITNGDLTYGKNDWEIAGSRRREYQTAEETVS